MNLKPITATDLEIFEEGEGRWGAEYNSYCDFEVFCDAASEAEAVPVLVRLANEERARQDGEIFSEPMDAASEAGYQDARRRAGYVGIR